MTTVIEHPADLIHGLGSENGKDMAKAAVDEINELADGLKKTLDAGVSPSDFQRLQTVHAAMKTAAAIVAMTYVVEQPD